MSAPGPRVAEGLRRLPSEPRAASVRVRYAETDRMGIAYHAEYFVWFEVGRASWIRGSQDGAAGRSYADLEAGGFFLPVVEASSRYHLPARYDEELVVRVTLAEATRVRFVFEYEIARPADGARLAAGRTVHAVTDASGRPKRLPAAWMDWLLDGAPAPVPASTTGD